MWNIDLVWDLSHVVDWFDEFVESHDQVRSFQVESLNESSVVEPACVTEGSVAVWAQSPFRGVCLLALEAFFCGGGRGYDIFDRVCACLDVVLPYLFRFGAFVVRFGLFVDFLLFLDVGG